MIITNWKGAKIIVGYVKACDVLPDDLISLIQEYIDGEYLYIPRKKENKKSWGEISGVRKDLSIRNREIYLMNYRKIDFDNVNGKELELLLLQIAKWHNLIPKLWIPDYKVSELNIKETVQRIKNTKKEDLFLAIAEDKQGCIQGFIWACKQEKPQDSVMILSLYVTEDYRGQGVATNLKMLLEEWCRQEGIKAIETTVHYSNNPMIELNKKLGYTPGMVYMTKTL